MPPLNLKCGKPRSSIWIAFLLKPQEFVPKKLSQKDFVTFIKGACLNEQSLFRNALIKLFSRHRNTNQGAVYDATVDGIIAASIDDFVKSKVRP